jgi:hypothetical protein
LWQASAYPNSKTSLHLHASQILLVPSQLPLSPRRKCQLQSVDQLDSSCCRSSAPEQQRQQEHLVVKAGGSQSLLQAISTSCARMRTVKVLV